MFSTVPGVTKCEVMNERHSNQNNDKLRNQHNEQFLLALNQNDYNRGQIVLENGKNMNP